MWRSVAALGLAGAVASASLAQQPSPPKSGVEFQSADIQKLQADDFGNPGLLWVARGEALFAEMGCASCHQGDAMKGVAARHPRFDPALGRVVNLEGRINACVIRKPGAAPLAWESQELLALTAYIARQSHGMSLQAAPVAEPAMRSVLARGREIYFERQGQLNLACTQCHDGAWGRTLLAEKISQGQPADWPAYRLEWQTLGSLQRRLRACYYGVRAALPDFGSPDLLALEVYLAQRGAGAALSPPGVRK